MIYYKNLFISTILSVLLILVIVAIVVSRSQKNQMYPSVFQQCPDYYYMDVCGNCVMNQEIWTVSSIQSGQTKLQCANANFTNLKTPGIGSTSALCSKKKWANDCGVTWDGITNNSSICYK
jgi:hypothetical protein